MPTLANSLALRTPAALIVFLFFGGTAPSRRCLRGPVRELLLLRELLGTH